MKNLWLLVTCMMTFSAAQASVIYVDVNASGSNNGTSWANAFTDLQMALSVSFINDEIWVAAGIYKPTTTLDRDISFIMKNGVDIYGGFEGTETAVNQRNIAANPTTLSGDIGQLGNNADNTKKVVRILNFTTNFVMDGFRIVAGYDASSSGRGAGAYLGNNQGAQITIDNCILYNNYAYREGGGMWIDESNVTMNNCDFLYNASFDYGGGGIYADNGSNSNIYLYDCSFIGQNSRDGTVITFDGDELVFERCLISNNTSTSNDLISIDNDVLRFEINNSLLIGNLLNDSGGALVSSFSSGANTSSITNSTICHNRNNSSLIPSQEMISQWNSAMNIRNCIIYGNTNSDNSMQIDPGNNVVNSIVENGYAAGINVTNANPQFVAPSSLAAAPFDASSFDYSLLANSPAVNTGNNTYAGTFPSDYAGAVRIQQFFVDLGALESPYADMQPPVANCTDTVVYLDNSGLAVIDSSYIDDNSTDNMGIVSYSLNNTTFSCADLGLNLVEMTIMDATGNSDMCVSAVTVIDNVPPSVTLQNCSLILAPSGQVSLILTDILVSAYDNCGVDTITFSPALFTCNEVGNQTVQVTITDESGNSSIAPVTVSIMDTVVPVALAQNVDIYLTGLGGVNVTAAMVNAGSYDNCALAAMSVNPGFFNCTDLGLNNVTFSVTDMGGNVATAAATVNVIDTITPVTIGQNIIINLDISNPYTITPANVNNGSYDNCSLTQSLSQTSFNAVGVFDVDLTSTDPSGNSSSVTVQVQVINSAAEIQEQQNVTVNLFPNPTEGELTVRTSFEINRIIVRNLSGQELVYWSEFPDPFQANIDLRHLPAGMYFIEVYALANTPICTKFTKTSH